MRIKVKLTVPILKLCKRLLFLSCMLATNMMHAEFQLPALEEAEGVVRGLDFENNVAVIDGLSYFMPVDAQVEIRGTYGAFTLLERGMKVSFSYYRISDSRREIVKLVQLSDNRRMDEH